MLGGCKTEKELHAKLDKWRELGDDIKLIHTIKDDYLKTSELGVKSAESVFNSWDVISCSLISLKKASKIIKSDGEGLASWETTRSATGLFFELGFIMDVPVQNILGTHSHDVWFPNHAGTKNNNTWALVDAVISGKGYRGGENKWPSKSGHSYNRIETPEHIMRFTDFSESHNEVLVVGKQNINIYPGYKPTDKIKVSAIVVAQQYQSGHSLFSRGAKDELSKKLHILRKVNPSIKVIDLSKI
jgi:hypothetical protein